MQSQIFFVISSIGFVILWILSAVFLVYLIRVIRIIHKIIKAIDKDVHQLSDKTKDVFLDIQDSLVFRLLFNKRKERKNSKKI